MKPAPMEREQVVGIDLGTTFSVAAYVDDGVVKVIPSREGGTLIPSAVAFTKDGACVVGKLARAQAVAAPERTILSIKRRMGSDWTSAVDGKVYTPQEISALILRRVKQEAEAFLGRPVQRAVITVPAYFNDNQRQATMEAGLMAGLEVMRIISEPTAAALAYGLQNQDIQRVLIWDLGGGTFDVSLLELAKGLFQVKAVNGNTHLGGDDWDQRIMEVLADRFQKSTGIDLRSSPQAWQRLKEASEQAKIELSSKPVAEIRIPFIAQGQTLQARLTREEFEAMTGDLLQQMVKPTQEVLADAKLTPDQIDRVVLVGGSTRMPAVQGLARNLLKQEPYLKINPDEAVAVGAAIQAAVLTGHVKDVVLVDVTPLSLGIETEGGLFAKLIERNSPIPTSAGQIFTTAKDNQPQVDIHVLQGERVLAAHNISLGQLTLDGIPLARRGEPQIEVTFHLDANGILSILAQDLYTETSKTLRITSATRLDPKEVDRLCQEAKAHAQEDRGVQDRIQRGIRAEGMISAAQRVMKDADGAVPPSELDELEQAIMDLKSALAEAEAGVIDTRTNALKDLVDQASRVLKAKMGSG